MQIFSYLGSGNNELEFRYEESSAHYSLWKPPGNYFPRGEAPPPYEEAVRSAQVEHDIINTQIRTANSACLSQVNVNVQNTNRQMQNTEIVQPYLHSRLETTTTTNTNVSNTNQYANVTIQNVAVHNTDNSKLETQNVKLQQKPKVNVTERNNSNRHADGPEKVYENVMSSSSGKLNTCKRSKPASAGYSKMQKQENTYENCNAEKSTVFCNKHENIILDNNNLVADVHKIRRTDKERSKENNSVNVSGGHEDVNVYDNRHRTILNLSEYQSYNVPLMKGQRDPNTKYPNRERKLRLGERSENNLKSLSKLSELKELPLHRTLPKNLRDLFAREMPKDIKIESENLRRSQSTSYDASLTLSQIKSSNAFVEKNDKPNDLSIIQSVPVNFATYKKDSKESWARNPNTNTNDEEHSFVSYQCLSSSQDDDDYRYVNVVN